MIDVLVSMKISSIATVGTSAIRMRLKALAIEASMPMRENEESNASLEWN
jgi:hypothetical protein